MNYNSYYKTVQRFCPYIQFLNPDPEHMEQFLITAFNIALTWNV